MMLARHGSVKNAKLQYSRYTHIRPIMKPRLLEKYTTIVIPALQTKFGYKSSMAVPRIKKVVINVGTGRYSKEPKFVQRIESDLAKITGQKTAMRKAKQSISGFKLRAGMPVGLIVTLRRNRMYDFIDRLIAIALPRSRDFHGLTKRNVDKHGNLNIGIKESSIFPEITYESSKDIFSFQITLVTNASSQEIGTELFRELGVPLEA